jgi:2-hydroxy-3-keto-5-methylthiopentenyl-1-phosphate phosphatase
LLKEGVRPEQLADAVRGSNVTLRGGVEEMFELLQRGEVPLLVFRAGIANVIAEVFKQKLRFPLVDSTHIISNWMIFDASQTHVGFSQPLIHMFNKDEVRWGL